MCTQTPSVLRFAQLRELTGTRRAVARVQQSGLWQQQRRGVYVAASACESVRVAAEHGGALACVSAARHLGLWTLADEADIHVWMPHGGRTHHDECDCVAHFDAIDTDAFSAPSVPRLLRQILRCQGTEAFFVTLESALRQRTISSTGLAWLHAHTNAEARAAIAYARKDADSGLESVFRWRLRTLNLQLRSQVKIAGVGTVDFLIGDRLIVEIDGRENHDGTVLRHKDLVRDAAAAALDYVTLRFDYAQVVHDWTTVEAAILSQLIAGRHLR
ncbi:DUF559 domain-containing protein (plasmid) [Coraliomargarita sp. W4R53]